MLSVSRIERLSEQLRPGMDAARGYMTAMSEVLHCIQRSESYKISGIMCSENFSKGFLSKKLNDCECAIFVEGMQGDSDPKAVCEPVLRAMKEQLQELNSAKQIVQGDIVLSFCYRNVNFFLRPVPSEAPFDRHDELLDYMSNLDGNNWPWLGGCNLAELTRYLQQQENTRMRQLARIMKNWIYSLDIPEPRNEFMPNTIAIELLCLHALQGGKSGGSGSSVAVMIERLMCELARPEQLQEKFGQSLPKSVEVKRPLLVDPTNPMYNVADLFRWDQIQKAAQRELDTKFHHFESRVTGGNFT